MSENKQWFNPDLNFKKGAIAVAVIALLFAGRVVIGKTKNQANSTLNALSCWSIQDFVPEKYFGFNETISDGSIYHTDLIPVDSSSWEIRLCNGAEKCSGQENVYTSNTYKIEGNEVFRIRSVVGGIVDNKEKILSFHLADQDGKLRKDAFIYNKIEDQEYKIMDPCYKIKIQDKVYDGIAVGFIEKGEITNVWYFFKNTGIQKPPMANSDGKTVIYDSAIFNRKTFF